MSERAQNFLATFLWNSELNVLVRLVLALSISSKLSNCALYFRWRTSGLHWNRNCNRAFNVSVIEKAGASICAAVIYCIPISAPSKVCPHLLVKKDSDGWGADSKASGSSAWEAISTRVFRLPYRTRFVNCGLDGMADQLIVKTNPKCFAYKLVLDSSDNPETPPEW